MSKLFVYLFLVFSHNVTHSVLSIVFSSEPSSLLTPAGEHADFLRYSDGGEEKAQYDMVENQPSVSTKTFDPFEFDYLVAGGYRPISNNLVKYVVSLRIYDSPEWFGAYHYCGGSIIHKKFIVTAAHCLFDEKRKLLDAEDISVVAGTPNRLQKIKTSQVIKAMELMPHPNYKHFQSINYDIGLVLLSKHLTLGSSVAMVLLPNMPPAVNMKCTAVGWGRVVMFGPLPAEVLNIDLKIRPKSLCENYPIWTPVSMICVGDPKFFEVSTCKGDSGGPLICNNKLYGIISFGFGCGSPGYNGVCTDLFFYRDWLEPSTRGLRPDSKSQNDSLFFNNSVDFKTNSVQYYLFFFCTICTLFL